MRLDVSYFLVLFLFWEMGSTDVSYIIKNKQMTKYTLDGHSPMTTICHELKIVINLRLIHQIHNKNAIVLVH